jgi:cell division protein FtsB
MRLRTFDITVMLVSTALLAYHCWHGFYGPRNFAYRDYLIGERLRLQGELTVVTGERENRDRKVALMRPESVDPDMLDELARRDLNFARPKELILIQK